MRPVYILLTIIVLFGAGMSPRREYKITVNIIGLHSDKGKLYLSLFNSAAGYPKNASAAFRLASASISGGRCTIVLDTVPGGTYAIACYHDENNNGNIDSNFFGMPVEGTGASNNARGSWGPPKFQNAKFIVQSDTSQTIKIVY